MNTRQWVLHANRTKFRSNSTSGAQPVGLPKLFGLLDTLVETSDVTLSLIRRIDSSLPMARNFVYQMKMRDRPCPSWPKAQLFILTCGSVFGLRKDVKPKIKLSTQAMAVMVSSVGVAAVALLVIWGATEAPWDCLFAVLSAAIRRGEASAIERGSCWRVNVARMEVAADRHGVLGLSELLGTLNSKRKIQIASLRGFDASAALTFGILSGAPGAHRAISLGQGPLLLLPRAASIYTGTGTVEAVGGIETTLLEWAQDDGHLGNVALVLTMRAAILRKRSVGNAELHEVLTALEVSGSLLKRSEDSICIAVTSGIVEAGEATLRHFMHEEGSGRLVKRLLGCFASADTHIGARFSVPNIVSDSIASQRNVWQKGEIVVRAAFLRMKLTKLWIHLLAVLPLVDSSSKNWSVAALEKFLDPVTINEATDKLQFLLRFSKRLAVEESLEAVANRLGSISGGILYKM